MSFDAISIGPFLISTGGVVLLVGILLATKLLLETARKKELSINFLSKNLFWFLLIALISGRVGMMITSSSSLSLAMENADFFEKILIFIKHFLYFWQGGFDYTWLIIGFMVALILFAYIKKQALRKWLDAFVLPALLVAIFIHLGGFLSGWGYGKPVGENFPDWLAIKYNLPSVRFAGEIYPVQIYGAILFGLLFYFGNRLWQKSFYRRRHWKGGTYFAIMTIFASLANVFLEFFRGNPATQIGVFRFPQLLSLLLAVGALIFLVINTHERKIKAKADKKEDIK